jgi:hypothetical protein
MSIVFWVGIGCFIGWNFPQPTYASVVQNWVMGLFGKAKKAIDTED